MLPYKVPCMDEDNNAIDQVLKQAPIEVSFDDAKKAYLDSSRDIAKAIAVLWKIDPLPEKAKKVGDKADKWDEVRAIYDEFDAEASRILSDTLKNNIHNSENNKNDTSNDIVQTI